MSSTSSEYSTEDDTTDGDVTKIVPINRSSTETLDDGVKCYIMMNGAKIYFNEIGNELYWGRISDKYSVDNVPNELTFGGELNSSLFFYTVLRDDNDLLWNFTFYQLVTENCFKCVGEGPYELKKIGEVKKETDSRQMFACQQPYFLDTMKRGNEAVVKNFKTEIVATLSKKDYGSIEVFSDWKFFIHREIVHIVRYCWHESEKSSVEISDNFVTIIVQDGRYQFHPDTSIYAQDETLVYILSHETLLVIDVDFEANSSTILTFDIGEFPGNVGRIGGFNRGRIFVNAYCKCFGYDLDEKHSRPVTIGESESLPKNFKLYRLMNGSKMFVRNDGSNEIYSDRERKNCATDLPQETLHFGGEWNNALYFHSVKDQTYTFYKFWCENEKIEFSKIGEITTTREIRFLLNQPFFIYSLTDGTIMIENFNRRQLLKVDGSHATHGKMFDNPNRIFVRRDLVYFVRKRGPQAFNVGTRKLVRNQNAIGYFSLTMGALGVEIVLDDPTNRIGTLSAPISVYAQDSSLIYVLCGTKLLIIGGTHIHQFWHWETFELVSPNCSISGIGDGKLYLNNDSGQHFSQILGEDLEWMQDEEQDEGFETASTPGRYRDYTNGITEVRNAVLDDENKRLQERCDRLKQDSIAREKRIVQLNNKLNELRESIGEGKPQFASKFEKEYEVEEILGVGGGGCVFKVTNKFDECTYAVKRVAVDPIDEVIDQSLAEVRAMAQLDHPGIVRYNSTWIEKPPEDWQDSVDDSMFRKMKKRANLRYNANSFFIYIQMQLCNYSLANWLGEYTSPEHRKLSRMKSWFEQIASAVAYIHEQNLIHRDLKPGNILFVEKDHLKICDLGIATERKVVNGEEITTNRTSVGTREYMSPEQFASIESASDVAKINSKSDVFTLGLILTELCVVMNYNKKVEVFNNYRNGRPNSIFDDANTATFVAQLTQVESKKRPTCEEMLKQLYFA